MHANPLGGVCGMVCPDTLCMAACSRKKFDGSINIPLVQATIVEMAKGLGGIPEFSRPKLNGKKVAVVGGGPAGLGAAAALAQMGYSVDIFEAGDRLGGMMNLIPDHRLEKKVVETDIQFLLSLGNITAKTGAKVEDPKELLKKGYDAVCVTVGLWKPIELGIPNEALAIKMVDLLSRPSAHKFDGSVAVIGGGATAIDCAITAKSCGAAARRAFHAGKTLRNAADRQRAPGIAGFRYRAERAHPGHPDPRRALGKSPASKPSRSPCPKGQPFSPAAMRRCPRDGKRPLRFQRRRHRHRHALDPAARAGWTACFYAGDMLTGPKTVVQATASGKNAALEIDAYLKRAA